VLGAIEIDDVFSDIDIEANDSELCPVFAGGEGAPALANALAGCIVNPAARFSRISKMGANDFASSGIVRDYTDFFRVKHVFEEKSCSLCLIVVPLRLNSYGEVYYRHDPVAFDFTSYKMAVGDVVVPLEAGFFGFGEGAKNLDSMSHGSGCFLCARLSWARSV
jgi:hypothetical protein